MLRDIFRKPEPEKVIETPAENTCTPCPACNNVIYNSEIRANLGVCKICGHHFRMGARERINTVADSGTFKEFFTGVKSENILNFPGYGEKLFTAKNESGEDDSVICGTCEISGMQTCVFSMEANFMMGSMGILTGEKITRLFEFATDKSLPVIGFCVSGGARMQEGIFSLMQMAKTSGAVLRHSQKKNLYVSVLTDPTSGGVTASFAMEADIIISEPKALICFAGPRVIEQTIKQKLPEGFQRAEFLLEKGFIDEIVDRRNMKTYLSNILSLHSEA